MVIIVFNEILSNFQNSNHGWFIIDQHDVQKSSRTGIIGLNFQLINNHQTFTLKIVNKNRAALPKY